MSSLGSSASAFFKDSVGLEKSLRLVQYFAQIIIVLSIGNTAPWTKLRIQMTTARRYFRLFNWLGSAEVVRNKVQSQQMGLLDLLEGLKAAFFGIYFFMEMLSITEALDVTHSTWGANMLRHALEFWFYALATSCVLETYKLLFPPQVQTPPVKTPRKQGAVAQPKAKRQGRSFMGLFHACCDILIPGSLLGWLPVDPLLVGIAGSLTSLMSIRDVWTAIQKR